MSCVHHSENRKQDQPALDDSAETRPAQGDQIRHETAIYAQYAHSAELRTSRRHVSVSLLLPPKDEGISCHTWHSVRVLLVSS